MAQMSSDQDPMSSWPKAAADICSLIQIQAGAVVSRTLLKRSVGNVTLFAFDAGQELSEHTAPFDALVLVVQGQAEITIAGEAHTVRKGEILLMPGGRPHAVRASGELKMLLTMIRQ